MGRARRTDRVQVKGGLAKAENPEWLPAIQQHGEGLFIQINAGAVEAWLDRTDTRSLAKRLMTGFRNWADRRPGVRPRDVVYAPLHSLSHALLTEIALDCGYPASALKERIYALPPATPEGTCVPAHPGRDGGESALNPAGALL
jgi:hypothetical protein